MSCFTNQKVLIIMKKTFIAIIALLILQSCTQDPNIGNGLDTISIISLTPSNNLIDGEVYQFKVKIEYDLVAVKKGVLNIGFNTNKVQSFLMVSSSSVVIPKGTGVHTFDVKVRAKNYVTGGEDFKVYVNLSNKYPFWVNKYTPLASDEKPLKFKS